jgi:hypothetical protein
MNVHLILLVFAFVLFVLSGFISFRYPAPAPTGEPYWRSLISFGLACWVAASFPF